MRIAKWSELPDRDAATSAIDKIFFAASATQTFADDATRAAFRERWLGRYFTHDPQRVFVAIA